MIVSGIARVFEQHHKKTCVNPAKARRGLLAVLRARAEREVPR